MSQGQERDAKQVGREGRKESDEQSKQGERRSSIKAGEIMSDGSHDFVRHSLGEAPGRFLAPSLGNTKK